MSSLSFNFNDASDTLGDSEPESPVLEGYLRPLGGPIYSFYDYDEDEGGSDLDFAPPSRSGCEDDLEMETVKNARAVVGSGAAEVEVPVV